MEYAARGGNKNKVYKYSGSDTVNDVAWYWDNSGRKTQEVERKYQMSWSSTICPGTCGSGVSDWYGGYSVSAQTNPYNNSGSGRVLRGGSWYDNAAFVRVAFRNDRLPAYTNFRMGFRITRTVP
jgi:formylglycine-generating enzyme required for sulfatase activity